MVGVTAVSPIVSASTQVSPAFWLNVAHGVIRDYCGWHVAPVITETLELDGGGGTTLLLPSKRVREIKSVINDGRDVTGQVKFSRRAGVLTLGSGWSCDVGSITITLEHGFRAEEVPAVAGLIVTLTQRAASGGGNVVQQGIGPASVRRGTGRDGGVLGAPLLESEKETLAPYRLNWGP